MQRARVNYNCTSVFIDAHHLPAGIQRPSYTPVCSIGFLRRTHGPYQHHIVGMSEGAATATVAEGQVAWLPESGLRPGLWVWRRAMRPPAGRTVSAAEQGLGRGGVAKRRALGKRNEGRELRDAANPGAFPLARAPQKVRAAGRPPASPPSRGKPPSRLALARLARSPLQLKSPAASSKARTHCAANSGLRSWMTGRASAHAAQYAAGLSRVAGVRPSPPSRTGIDAKARARSHSAPSARVFPGKARAVVQIASSCALA